MARSKIDSTTMPKVHAYRAAALVSASGGSKIIFDTETVDSHNAYNNSTGVFTAPYAGDYLFSVGGGNTAATATIMYWFLKKNGTTTIRQGTVWNPSNANNRQTLTTTVSLAASDTIEAWYVGGNGSTVAVGQENLFIDINYLP